MVYFKASCIHKSPKLVTSAQDIRSKTTLSVAKCIQNQNQKPIYCKKSWVEGLLYIHYLDYFLNFYLNLFYAELIPVF